MQNLTDLEELDGPAERVSPAEPERHVPDELRENVEEGDEEVGDGEVHDQQVHPTQLLTPAARRGQGRHEGGHGREDGSRG